MRITGRFIVMVIVAVVFGGIATASLSQAKYRPGQMTEGALKVLSERSTRDPGPFLLRVSDPGHSALAGDSFTDRTGIQFKDGDHARIDLAEGAGFGVIRKGLYWGRVEKARGEYDFKWFDEIVALARERGMVVSATLYGNNPAYGYDGEDGVGIVTEAGRQGFAKFAAAAAARYADDPVVFEVWNEPNLRTFWRAHPANPDRSNLDEMADEYTLLVRAVVPAMKHANPDVFVSAGSISALWRESFSWFDRTIEQGILDTGIDAISVHPYGFRWPELAEERGYSVIRRKLARAGHGDLAIVNTEVGFPANDWITDRGYSPEEAMKLQGALLIRQQLLDYLYKLDYSIWYEFRSADTYGILDDGFTPRPAHRAAKTLHDELNGYALVGREATGREEDFLLRFTNGKTDKIVAWTSPPRFRKTAVRHSIDTGFDILGIKDTFGDDIPVDPAGLHLSEYPQFVAVVRPARGAAEPDQMPEN